MRSFLIPLALSAALFTGGCEAVALGVATPMVIQQKHVNLTNASYAAADSISQQAGKRFAKERPLYVSDLQEIFHKNQPHPPGANAEDLIDRALTGEPKPSPKVGQVLSAQMRDRFIQLGYKVVTSTAAQTGGALGLVSGTYEFVSGTMIVSLKLKDQGTGEIVTLYNYSLPMTYDIRKYMTGGENVLPPLL
jgi:hypothetical protein